MAYDDEDYFDESDEGGIARWVPFVVVFVALGGFVMLAWYAYQAGTGNVNEDELLIVEADNTPVKEKPDDPGGMQFPNKDKMIFETIAGQSAEHPKVERIMPEAEEPVAVEENTQTASWVNDKLKEGEVKVEEVKSETKEAFAQKAAKDEKTVTIEEDVVKSYRKEEELVVVKAEPEPVKKEVAPKVVEAKPAAGGKMMVQLGAYRSQSEANAGWEKISKKYDDLLSGYSHRVVRADLGAKGIYYRLRVPGFSSMDSARSFCKKLSAKGQACLPTSG